MPMCSMKKKRKKNNTSGKVRVVRVMIRTKWPLLMTKVGSTQMRTPSTPLTSSCPGKMTNMLTMSLLIKRHAALWHALELREASIQWLFRPTSGLSHDMEEPTEKLRVLDKDKKVNSPHPKESHQQRQHRKESHPV